jgi:ubiquinone biosynthesis accessory factor UbiK
MINVQYIEELSIKFSDLVKNSPAGDIQANFRALLEGAFTKLELVSREEFDIQTEVLRHTREKLNELEAKLERMESLETKAQ